MTLTQRSGNMSYSDSRGESFEYSIYGGYSLTNKISFLLSINGTLRNEYGYSFSNLMMESREIRKYVYWIIKAGIEYAF